MDVIALSETQQLVQDAIKDYLERKVPFDRIREVEASGDYDRNLWKDLTDSSCQNRTEKGRRPDNQTSWLFLACWYCLQV